MPRILEFSIISSIIMEITLRTNTKVLQRRRSPVK
jgi:hypothetical protein